MQEESYLGHQIERTSIEVRYDEAVKRLLANKLILATIMQGCVEEYRNCTVQEIAEQYIEDEPQIGTVGVNPDDTNPAMDKNIYGSNTEDATLTEGTVRYDIRFYAAAPAGDGRIGLIINLEAQNKYNPGYPLLKRALYYCSRMISAQHGVEFTHSEYGKIKKVYSIWVCTNPPAERQNTIMQYSVQQRPLVGQVDEPVQNYDLLSAIMICLGEPEQENYTGVLKFLEVLLSDERTAKEKKEILQEEFHLPMTQHLESEVLGMCNLSQGAIETGFKRGEQMGIKRGEEIGKEIGTQTATLNAILNVVKNLNVSVDKAMDILGIAEKDRAFYRAKLN